MRIGVTGATGFLGRYLVAELAGSGQHHCRCWTRATSDRSGFEPLEPAITWVPGDLDTPGSERELVEGCDAVVHSALFRPGDRFMGGEGDLVRFVETNVLGTIRLIEAARHAGVPRFVVISTCAVHDVILGDRPLDETHPLWPASHYGAHKAAIEAFVHSYGLGQGYTISALRPTGIYGLAHPADRSKWFDLVAAVARGEDVECRRGGKEVHAADVARGVSTLLGADPEQVAGQSFNCYDRYISEHEVASIARDLSGARGSIRGAPTTPRNQIVTAKLQALGMQFGGRSLLERTIAEMLGAARSAG
jgi:nucleoside-diphosphate-sugar epimerase